jgi:putative flippase GtrA
MRRQAQLTDTSDRTQVARYAINGLFATAVHFAVLSFNLQVVGMSSAGMANMFAAVVGISVSFLGSRYFVFCNRNDAIFRQVAKFGLLYALIASLHGIFLYIWSDVWKLDYRIGFLFATVFQVILSYWGNKILVFKNKIL